MCRAKAGVDDRMCSPYIHNGTDMKKPFFLHIFSALAALLMLSGCVASIGNSGAQRGNATLGQQLIDLQKAKDAGAITESEYQTQKTRLLEHK